MMKQYLAALLGTSILLTGCATADSNSEMKKEMADPTAAAIAQASSDLDAAKKASAHWRIIDKATGGSAAPLSKLLKVAKKKAEAGEADEAQRIAKQVSKFSKMGIEQAALYKGATPYYTK